MDSCRKRELVEEWLMENKGMIFKLAYSRYKYNFNTDEILSEAAIAVYEFCEGKWRSFSKIKSGSLIYRYIQKRFDKLDELGFETKGVPDESTDSMPDVDHILADPLWQEPTTEDALADAIDLMKFGAANNDQEMEKDAAFYVCSESFADHCAPRRVISALRVLIKGSASGQAISEVKEAYGAGKVNSLRCSLIKDIRLFVKTEKVRIFKGECLNGRRSHVIVCAKNQEAAKPYMEKFGVMLNCTHITI